MEPRHPNSRRSGLTLPAVHPDARVRTLSWPSVVGSHASHCDQAKALSSTTANIGKSTRRFECRTLREFTDEFQKPRGWTVGSHADCPARLVLSFEFPVSRDGRVSRFPPRCSPRTRFVSSNTIRFSGQTSSIQFIHSIRSAGTAVIIGLTELHAVIRVTDGVVVLGTTRNRGASRIFDTVRNCEFVGTIVRIVIFTNVL